MLAPCSIDASSLADIISIMHQNLFQNHCLSVTMLSNLPPPKRNEKKGKKWKKEEKGKKKT